MLYIGFFLSLVMIYLGVLEIIQRQREHSWSCIRCFRIVANNTAIKRLVRDKSKILTQLNIKDSWTSITLLTNFTLSPWYAML